MAGFTYSPIYTNAAGSLVGLAWGPGAASCRITAPLNSDEIQDEVSLNQTLYGMHNVLAALGGAEVPYTSSTLSNGTTVTLAASASVISINGVSAVVAALTAQAFGSLGTIPQNTWGLIKVQRVLAGTCTFVSAANNYTTGYATEALAIAAMPATTADRVAIGFITISSTHASGWVAGTDAMLGQTGGNPATSTNFYSFIGAADVTTGPWASVKQIANKSATVVTTTAG